jgi:glycosyltransferase involved in cell wall biosynthesis
VRALADPVRGVEVTGYVPDVRPHLWSAAVSVAPLLTARGVQNKVLEAVAAGLPAVVTGGAAGGVPSEVLPACAVAETPDQFASAVVSMLALTPTERRQRAERADLSALSWDRRLSPLRGILEHAAGFALR